MFWFILFGLMIVGGVLLIIFGDYYLSDLGWIPIVIGVVFLLLVIGQAVDKRNQVATYPDRKAFYESVTIGSEYEDATFKIRKAELNDGLFKAQWYRETMPFFSLWPKEVLKLEPIK